MSAVLIAIKPISVNAAWQGKRYKTPEYKAFEKHLLLSLPKIDIPKGLLKIELEWGFSNMASDWDNPIKPFQDVLQKKYGFDDNRIYEAHVKKRKVLKGHEYIKFKLTESKP